ncbi:MAG: pyruvate:ferredoxin (flavodoxin) oxidoreductase, partial [Oscillospiraceae bacterium]|nr:pyruvate:ferredoxin (flavodoxin) oxidoreductase [Oscillospiraceae bacterium]
HSDVMSCRSTGYAMLASSSPQEVMDLAAVAHLATVPGRVPVMHFFDGFRTSHELQDVQAWEYEDLADMLDWDALWHFRKTQNNPNHPVLKGSAENPDTFFQHREASNMVYDKFPAVVEEYMDKVNAKIGTDYKLFNYYGAPDATEVIIAMGSVCETAEEVVDYLNANGNKVGLIKVRLYRPFSIKHLIDVIPDTVQNIGVLDRTKEPGAHGEPLYLDVVAALKGSKFDQIPIVGGRYGLASKDTPPSNIIAVFRNLQADSPRNRFTVGIEDDVTHLSLPITENPVTSGESIVSCKFWGIGGDGTVGANKNTCKILGDHANKRVQAYFQYDSKKSGGVTQSHIRFGDEPIRSTYFVTHSADFVGCHVPSYISRYDMATGIKPGGIFLINGNWDIEELGRQLPAAQKKYIAENNIKVFTCDAVRLAQELGLGARTNTILQAAFFKLNPQLMPVDEAVSRMKEAATEAYKRKGDKVVAMNHAAIDAGVENVLELQVPDSWKNPPADAPKPKTAGDRADLVDFVDRILKPIAAVKGDTLPVSTFVQDRYSTFPQGSAAYEKRGIAVNAPDWIPENCIQCNQCVYVCPHSIIRPYVLTEAEVNAAPAGFKSLPLNGAKGVEGMHYALGTSVMDCMGAPSCGSCATVCPAKEKAIVMKPLNETLEAQASYNYCDKQVTEKDLSAYGAAFQPTTVKGSQFKRPLLEFHGACAGCGETPYAKLVTQLFGERMYIVNSTGCSSIWGGTYSQTPYTVNAAGQGPAWLNSLFEDTAEAGLGVYFGAKKQRERAKMVAESIVERPCSKDPAIAEPVKAWLAAYDEGEESNATGKVLKAALEASIAGGNDCKRAAELLHASNQFMKPSVWCFGGDGWAYDIGYGGLDHVIASGEDINMLVFDTEIYSNTGGQASKASQLGQVAQFAAAGKPVRKKDLAQIAMAYGYVYV